MADKLVHKLLFHVSGERFETQHRFPIDYHSFQAVFLLEAFDEIPETRRNYLSFCKLEKESDVLI